MFLKYVGAKSFSSTNSVIYEFNLTLVNEKIDLLNKAIRSSYRLEQTAYNGINIAVASSLNTIKFLENELKQVNKAILDTVSGLDSNAYNSLLSIRGIGKVYAAIYYFKKIRFFYKF